MKRLTIQDKSVTVFGNPAAKRLLLWPVMAEQFREGESCYQELQKQIGSESFALAMIRIDNWNKELSPWEYRDGNMEFEGGTSLLLDWIEHAFLPEYEKMRGTDPEPLKIFIGGYSLAGLFSLWAAYETKLFYGAASCSGSLWYPGFLQKYSEAHAVPKVSRMYFSLGEKESRTRHPLMSLVEKNTRKVYEDCLRSDSVKEVVFRKNPGGHFKDTRERTLAGFIWLAEEI